MTEVKKDEVAMEKIVHADQTVETESKPLQEKAPTFIIDTKGSKVSEITSATTDNQPDDSVSVISDKLLEEDSEIDHNTADISADIYADMEQAPVDSKVVAIDSDVIQVTTTPDDDVIQVTTTPDDDIEFILEDGSEFVTIDVDDDDDELSRDSTTQNQAETDTTITSLETSANKTNSNTTNTDTVQQATCNNTKANTEAKANSKEKANTEDTQKKELPKADKSHRASNSTKLEESKPKKEERVKNLPSIGTLQRMKYDIINYRKACRVAVGPISFEFMQLADLQAIVEKADSSEFCFGKLVGKKGKLKTQESAEGEKSTKAESGQKRSSNSKITSANGADAKKAAAGTKEAPHDIVSGDDENASLKGCLKLVFESPKSAEMATKELKFLLKKVKGVGVLYYKNVQTPQPSNVIEPKYGMDFLQGNYFMTSPLQHCSLRYSALEWFTKQQRETDDRFSEIGIVLDLAPETTSKDLLDGFKIAKDALVFEDSPIWYGYVCFNSKSVLNSYLNPQARGNFDLPKVKGKAIKLLQLFDNKKNKQNKQSAQKYTANSRARLGWLKGNPSQDAGNSAGKFRGLPTNWNPRPQVNKAVVQVPQRTLLTVANKGKKPKPNRNTGKTAPVLSPHYNFNPVASSQPQGLMNIPPSSLMGPLSGMHNTMGPRAPGYYAQPPMPQTAPMVQPVLHPMVHQVPPMRVGGTPIQNQNPQAPSDINMTTQTNAVNLLVGLSKLLSSAQGLDRTKTDVNPRQQKRPKDRYMPEEDLRPSRSSSSDRDSMDNWQDGSQRPWSIDQASPRTRSVDQARYKAIYRSFSDDDEWQDDRPPPAIDQYKYAERLSQHEERQREQYRHSRRSNENLYRDDLEEDEYFDDKEPLEYISLDRYSDKGGDVRSRTFHNQQRRPLFPEKEVKQIGIQSLLGDGPVWQHGRQHGQGQGHQTQGQGRQTQGQRVANTPGNVSQNQPQGGGSKKPRKRKKGKNRQAETKRQVTEGQINMQGQGNFVNPNARAYNPNPGPNQSYGGWSPMMTGSQSMSPVMNPHNVMPLGQPQGAVKPHGGWKNAPY